MTPKVLREIVKEAAMGAELAVDYATLPAVNLDQIEFLLGHVSIQTTEHYLGCKQKLRCAVNDKMGIQPEGDQ